MWTTTPSSNKKAIVFAAGLACFNTHAAVDVDVEAEQTTYYKSNMIGQKWSSVGVSVDNKTENETFQGIGDIVKLVKITLGLPNKDIADIFGVSRQTLHSYKSNPNEHTANSANMERAKKLSKIVADIGENFTRSPGAMAKNYLMDGKSLLELLSEEELNTASINKLAIELADKMDSSLNKPVNIEDASLFQLTAVS